MRWWYSGVGVAAALALAACASPEIETSGAAQFRAFYEDLTGTPVEDAREFGLSDAQAEILERAAARGEVTLGDLREAIDNSFACFDEHRIWHTPQQVVTYMGQDEIQYSVGPPPGVDDEDSAWLALVDACTAAQSDMIDELYQLQPTVEGSQEQWFAENLRDDLAACLARHGVTAPEGADMLWYSQAATDLAQPAAGRIDECEILVSYGVYGMSVPSQ